MKARVCAVIAVAALALPVAPAHAAPPLPAFCVPTDVVDNVCTVRLTSVTADVVDGTITGTPVGGGEAVTLAGQADAYLTSVGFGEAPPEPVRNWDTQIDQVSDLSTDPAEPNWYGNAKAKVFLPRTLNQIATEFPPDSLVVRFTPDDEPPGTYRLVSIRPAMQ